MIARTSFIYIISQVSSARVQIEVNKWVAYYSSYFVDILVMYFVLQGVCSQLEHSVVSLVTSPGLEEADTVLVTSLLNR